MPPTIWVITDTHFNHRKMIEKGYRPADYQHRIIRAWRANVRPMDTIIHLGDVICGRDSQLQRILTNLPGRKVLIRGNHDTSHDDAWFIESGFEMVCDALRIGKAYLTHEPQCVLPDGCIINVHGHLHADGHRDDQYALQPWHHLVALERTDYHPLQLQRIIGTRLLDATGKPNTFIPSAA